MVFKSQYETAGWAGGVRYVKHGGVSPSLYCITFTVRYELLYCRENIRSYFGLLINQIQQIGRSTNENYIKLGL